MFEYLTETMLHTYFLAEAAVGRFCEDKRTLFEAFARIFLLDGAERKRLRELVQSEELAVLTSEQRYMQYRRLKQYHDLRQDGPEEDPAVGQLIDIKGSALALAEKCRLPLSVTVQTVACENLRTAADRCWVHILVVRGILLREGIVLGKDETGGAQDIRKAADWNSVGGLFAALYYGLENGGRYRAALEDRLFRDGRSDVAKLVENVYGKAEREEGKDHFLLEKAFAQNSTVRRELYSKAYTRLIYSEAVDDKDKEAVVLSPNKELFMEASALPLKLSYLPATFCGEQLRSARPLAAEETAGLIARAENYDLRGIDGYRPLCLSSDSEYMTERYASAFRRAFPGANVCRIEVADLANYDLEPTKHNVFVRECAEDRFNVYLLFFRGEIREAALETVKNFLRTAKRRRFHLVHPGISIDLSPILPVCFCDGEAEARLEDVCDVVRVSPLTQEERLRLPVEIFCEKIGAYGAENVAMAPAVPEKLADYTPDEMEKILDAAVREHRKTVFELTEELVRSYYRLVCDKRQTNYGFGGNFHE